MAIRKITESTDIYSFVEQLPKMLDVFIQKGVIMEKSRKSATYFINDAVTSMEQDLNKLNDYFKLPESMNMVKKYTNNIEDKYYVLSICFNSLKNLYKRVMNLDESDPRFEQRIEDTKDDFKETMRTFFDAFYDI